jgi:hypothetical protein
MPNQTCSFLYFCLSCFASRINYFVSLFYLQPIWVQICQITRTQLQLYPSVINNSVRLCTSCITFLQEKRVKDGLSFKRETRTFWSLAKQKRSAFVLYVRQFRTTQRNFWNCFMASVDHHHFDFTYIKLCLL